MEKLEFIKSSLKNYDKNLERTWKELSLVLNDTGKIAIVDVMMIDMQ